MKYLKIRWIHENKNDPVLLFSEIDSERYELRKVEVFADGRMGFANEKISSEGTILGEAPIPLLEDLLSDPQFSGEEIESKEFEINWGFALKNSGCKLSND
jgi:hypothetical protein